MQAPPPPPSPPQAAARIPVAALLDAALTAHQGGHFSRAEQLYRQILARQPQHADACHLLGVLAYQSGQLREALRRIDQAIAIRPQAAAYHANRGNVLTDMSMHPQALASYDQALACDPQFVDALYNRGRLLKDLHRPSEALHSYDRALALQPQAPQLHNSRGNVLLDLHRWNEALLSFEHALQLKPDFTEAQNNLGIALLRLRRFAQALAQFEQVLAAQPQNVQALCHKGHALLEMQMGTDALGSFDQAIALDPDHAEAHYHRASVLKTQQRHEEALQSYWQAYRRKPDAAFNLGYMVHLQCQLCLWEGLTEKVEAIEQAVLAGKPVTPPFALMGLVDDPHLLRLAAQRWAADNVLPSGTLAPVVTRSKHSKIHVAYLSADFHQHATCHLLAQLFELHDHQQFELTAISFGPDKSDPMRQRVLPAFDRFLDVRHMSDIDVAKLCRSIGVDIAVDLKGYTTDARPGILAERCAPVQINYLGFPGTLGLACIDHIVADPVLIEPEDVAHYSEKVIWLPDSYMANDGLRKIADHAFKRSEVGLPDTGFVFCCFNNSYKILPPTFALWMRILERVPGSVLWLLLDNPTAARALQNQAVAHGVAAERLVFAPRMPPDLHLARHRLADLFIDTWPYNAHTTASDALWAGLPVLTRKGRSFASRVASSLLQALALPELSVPSDEAYEQLAVTLAEQPQLLDGLRQRLRVNRSSSALFDCARFTRHLEQAYQILMDRHSNGLPPEHLVVPGMGKSPASETASPAATL
jgi:predicted O-linked N-acetylglucosamine transferase (SPINDLY family)